MTMDDLESTSAPAPATAPPPPVEGASPPPAPEPPGHGLRWWWLVLIAVASVGLGWLAGALLLDVSARAVKGGAAGLSMALLVAAWVVDGRAASSRGWARAGVALTALLAAATVCGLYVHNLEKTQKLLYKNQVHAWNVFHYVLGTKYFDELGYFDLYNGVMLADSEARERFRDCPLTRDMHTYGNLSREAAIAQARRDGVKERFTEERWESFKADLVQIQKHRKRSKWCSTIRDLGYNPSPAWLIIHRPLLNAVDVSKRSTLARLCKIELILYALTFAAMWWAFGLRPALFGVMWINTFFGNENLLVGSYLHYDWLFLIVVAAALFRKGWPISAGVTLSYVAMMRGFPGLLAVGPGVLWLREVLRTRALPRQLTAFCLAVALGCVLMVLLGGTSARGMHAWSEWREKIEIHTHHHPLFAKRIGLKTQFVHDWETGAWTMSRSKREQVMERYEPAFNAVKWTMVALALLAMVRRREFEALLLGMIPAFALLVSSRYYASMWVLLLFWPPLDRRGVANLVSSLLLFGLIVFYDVFDAASWTHAWHSYFAINLYMALYFVAVMAFFLTGDARWAIRRLRSRARKEDAGDGARLA